MPKKYPNAADYDFAVTYIEKTVQSPKFRGGTPRKKKSGHGLFVSAGGYSRVYNIEFMPPAKLAKAALRCWTAEVSDAYRNYQTTAAYLSTRSLKYFVDYEYIPSGILVNSERYPITYMEWIEGRTLDKYIDENISDGKALGVLANEFLTMVQELHSNRIAHGDLQDGNILVVPNGNGMALKLIDYDSLFVPGLEGAIDQIKGLPAYQSPHRSRNKYLHPTMDYFSELVIYLSLLIYIERPGLWKKGLQDREMVFSEVDLQDPQTSKTFVAAMQMSLKVKYLTQKLIDFCRIGDTKILPSLEDVIREGENHAWQLGKGGLLSSAKFPKQQSRLNMASRRAANTNLGALPILPAGQRSSQLSSLTANKALAQAITCRICGEAAHAAGDIYCSSGHAIYGTAKCPSCRRQIPYKAPYCPRCAVATGW